MLSLAPLSLLIIKDDPASRANLLDILVLAACPNPLEVAIRCASRARDVYTVLRTSLRNNGPSSTPAQRKEFFSAVYMTETKGTGPGLVICRRLVKADGGRIDLGSGPCQGV